MHFIKTVLKPYDENRGKILYKTRMWMFKINMKSLKLWYILLLR